MRNLLVLFLFVICSCVMPMGTRINVKADGVIDKNEASLLISLHEKKHIVQQNSVPFYYLQNHITDMSIYIKKHVYPGWPGIYGLYLKIVKDRAEINELYDKCRITIFPHGHKPSSEIAGFFCPHNNSIVLMPREIEHTLDDYDHEEGHFINNVIGETSEFPAEFNRLWKIFIRQAAHKDLGETYFNLIHSNRPRDQKVRTIKKIGKYRAASLMFFMVMNHYSADLTKSAKFMFESNSKKLKKFFYKRLSSYPKYMTVRQIWEKEMFMIFDQGFLLRNVDNLRKRTSDKWNN